jgi:type IV pilus assembly protein PilM
MFSNLRNLFSRYLRKDLLAIDMDSSGVRFIKFSMQPERKIDEYYSYPFPIDGMSDKEMESLREFIRANGFNGMNAIGSIENTSLKIRRVDVPHMPEYDLAEAVKWNLRDIVEGPVENFIIRYSHLDEHATAEGRRLSLVGYAVRRDTVESRANWLKLIGLNPIAIEPNAVALLAAFDASHHWVKGQYHVVVHLGWEKTNFAVFGQGKLYFSRLLEKMSIKQSLDTIQQACCLNEEQAQVMKGLCVHKGVRSWQPFQDMPEIQTVLERQFHEFSLEIQRSIDSFLVMFHADKVESMTLSGPGSFLPGIEPYFQTNLGINAQQWKFQSPLGGDFKGLDPYFMIALGLGLPKEYS